MTKKLARKLEWLKATKRNLVGQFGCSQCATGQIEEGFERYWVLDPKPYDPQRYTFYHDIAGRGSISQEVLKASLSLEQLKDLVSESLIICRGCHLRWARGQEQKNQRQAGLVRMPEKGPRSPVVDLAESKG